MQLKQMTTKELKAEYIQLDHLIFEEDCYGVGDMLRLQAIDAELARRGE